MIKYSYAEGDLLKTPNTYFYTKYYGKEFILSWLNYREKILSNLPHETEIQISKASFSSKEWLNKFAVDQQVKTESLINDLLFEITKNNKISSSLFYWLNKFVKRFEVFKRIHESYNPNFRAVEKGSYKNLKLYLMTCALFDVAYSKTKDYTYLNAMLKCLDTLCAIHDQLDYMEKSHLSNLISNERNHILEISNHIGINL